MSWERDADSDGRIDFRVRAFYEDGLTWQNRDRDRFARREVDVDADGTWDSATSAVWDEQGNLLEWSEDTDNDGVIDSIDRYEYDLAGLPVLKKSDSDGDGVIDWETVFTYEIDGAGRPLSRVRDFGNDGEPDDIAYYSWSPEGLLELEEQDQLADGTLNESTAYTYDESGNLVVEEVDHSYEGEDAVYGSGVVDGVPDRITHYFYDEYGNPTEEHYDFRGPEDVADGEAEYIVEYDYECWPWGLDADRTVTHFFDEKPSQP